MTTVFDPFDAVFGAGVFGSAVFADLATTSGSGRGAGLIGGSGFPADWLERMGMLPGAGDLDDRELEELMAVGLIG